MKSFDERSLVEINKAKGKGIMTCIKITFGDNDFYDIFSAASKAIEYLFWHYGYNHIEANFNSLKEEILNLISSVYNISKLINPTIYTNDLDFRSYISKRMNISIVDSFEIDPSKFNCDTLFIPLYSHSDKFRHNSFIL